MGNLGLGSLQSLTGGGALSDSGGASADGDNYFDNGSFGYRNNQGSSTGTVLAVGLGLFVVGFVIAKAVK